MITTVLLLFVHFVTAHKVVLDDCSSAKILGPRCILQRGGRPFEYLVVSPISEEDDVAPSFSSFQWTLYSDVAKIQGPENEAMVSVGTTSVRSIKANDVKLSVAISPRKNSTLANSTCNISISLTILQVELLFRDNYARRWDDHGEIIGDNSTTGQVWSENNMHRRFTEFGDPHLGFIEPDKPPGAAGFYKSVEIQATLQPCVKHCLSTMRLLREKKGVSGVLYKNVFRENDKSAPNHWTLDESPLESPISSGCSIYSVDIPGMHVGRKRSCSHPGAVWFNFKNYREYLVMDGVPYHASHYLNWRASTRIVCQNNGTWEYDDSVPHANEVGLGHFTCLKNDPFHNVTNLRNISQTL